MIETHTCRHDQGGWHLCHCTIGHDHDFTDWIEAHRAP